MAESVSQVLSGLPRAVQRDVVRHHVAKREVATGNSTLDDFFHYQEDTHAEPRSSGYGGCTDSFSIFSFLAFLLILMEILMNMGMGGGRKKRHIAHNADINSFDTQMKFHDDGRLREAALSVFSLYVGFLNAVDAETEDCALRLFCEGAYEAAANGRIGSAMAKAASTKASSLLLLPSMEDAGRFGAKRGLSAFVAHQRNSRVTCAEAFPSCVETRRGAYRSPGAFPEAGLTKDSVLRHQRRQGVMAESITDEIMKWIF